MTNYERIKQMSVDELADFLCYNECCYMCAFCDRLCKVDEECHEGISEWLKREASDADN